MIKATSKKTGMEIRKQVITNAQEARSCPSFQTRVRARRCAPPDASSMAPNMEPRPTTTAMKPRVPPMPFCMVLMIASSGMPAARPTPSETSSSETKAWRRKTMTSTNRATMPRMATQSRFMCDVPP